MKVKTVAGGNAIAVIKIVSIWLRLFLHSQEKLRNRSTDGTVVTNFDVLRCCLLSQVPILLQAVTVLMKMATLCKG
ncbi:hypothetical protein IQ244_20330 [Nostoc sp. LEGE 06077]|nr:hypothetical protein [Nostoc sp. LEGE 06077]